MESPTTDNLLYVSFCNLYLCNVSIYVRLFLSSASYRETL